MKRFDEAIAEIRRALELDPLSVIINRIYADILVDARRFDEAIAAVSKDNRARSRTFRPRTIFLGRAYEAKGMYDQAVEAYSKSGAVNQVPDGNAKQMADIYKKSGWKAYVQANLDRLMAPPAGPLPPYVVVDFSMPGLVKNDEAIQWLEKAYEERDFRMIMITVSFEFDSLRSDPRFRDLVRRVGLPE